MAAGALSASLSGLKTRDTGLGFGKSMGFVRVSDLRRIKSGRTRVVSAVKNSSSGSDLAELQPASEGSPLLGIYIIYLNLSLTSVRRF